MPENTIKGQYVNLTGGYNIIGTPDKDILIGSPAADSITGLPSDDLINGFSGNDTLEGNEGDDDINGHEGNDYIFGNKGKDKLYGYDGDDSIYGGQDDDNIWGDGGNDYLAGDAGNDEIRGNFGNDILEGRLGNDTLFGGQDNDLLFGNQGDDALIDNEGNDSLYGGQGNDTADAGEGNDYVAGNEGNDLITGGIGSDTVEGGNGNDYIYGDFPVITPTFDLGNGLVPLPALEKRFANDLAQDLINGGAGEDTVLGGSGNDTITGAEDNDLLFGNTGTDFIKGGTGNDSIYGGADTDDLQGESGDDLIAGNLGNDVVAGGEGNDSLYGNQGNDDIKGDTGNDILYGGQDNDTLEGGIGSDTLAGNVGTDVFVLKADTGGPTINQADFILDFSIADDFIELKTGLAYETINISQGTAEFANDTVIRDGLTGQYLAIVKNIAASSLTRGDFLPALPEAPSPSPTPTPTPQQSVISLSAPTYNVQEPTTGTATLQVTVQRTNPENAASVAVVAAPGTAVQGTDYEETQQVVQFAAGEAVKTVNFTIKNDGNNNASTKDFKLTLANPGQGATLGTTNTATATITGVNPGKLEFSAPEYTIKEDGTVITQVTVKRTGGSQGQVDGNITLTPTDANPNPAIKTGVSIPVSFANGDSSDKVINLGPAININQVPSGILKANINLTVTSGGAAVGTPAVLNIEDLDSQSIKVEATDPRADENPNLAAPDQLGQFTFTRTGRDLSQPLTVQYTVDSTAPTSPTQNKPAVVGTDYQALSGSVTFAAGAATATVNVTPIRNPQPTGNLDVKVNIAQNPGYIIDTTSPTATVTVVDADSQIIEIAASVPAGKETAPGEAPQPGQFKVSRKDFQGNPYTTGDVTVSYVVAGNATAGLDYTPLAGTVLIPNGQSEVFLPVNVLDDTTPELTKSVRVTLSPGTGTNTYSVKPEAKQATVRILDNEKPTMILYPSKSPAFQANPVDTTSGPIPGEFLLQRLGDLGPALTVGYTFGNETTAKPGEQFSFDGLVGTSSNGVAQLNSGAQEVVLKLTPIVTSPKLRDFDLAVLGLNPVQASDPYALGTPSTGQQMLIINNAG